MASSLNGTGVTFSNGSAQSIAWPGASAQVFAASGTFTVPAGVTKIKVTCIGGGGGAQVNGYLGGWGGLAIGYYDVTAGASYTVTVGAGGAAGGGATGTAGGTSSFGALCSATGGSGANGSNTRTMGAGSGGTITNTGVGIGGGSAGDFVGNSQRTPLNSNQNAAVAWSPTLTILNSEYGRAVAGARGGFNFVPCVGQYTAGGVGGAVLVNW